MVIHFIYLTQACSIYADIVLVQLAHLLPFFSFFLACRHTLLVLLLCFLSFSHDVMLWCSCLNFVPLKLDHLRALACVVFSAFYAVMEPARNRGMVKQSRTLFSLFFQDIICLLVVLQLQIYLFESQQDSTYVHRTVLRFHLLDHLYEHIIVNVQITRKLMYRSEIFFREIIIYNRPRLKRQQT